MPALLYIIAGTVVSNIIQLIVGCLLSFAVFTIVHGKISVSKNTLKLNILIAALFSLCGILLPLGIYGVIPLIVVLLAVGFRCSAALSLLVSNVMFNMLVPFNDPSFIWKTGIRQVVFAFIAGFVAGLVALIVINADSKVFRQRYMPKFNGDQSKRKMVFHFIDDNFKKLGLFLIAGVIADTVFQRYVLSYIVNTFYTNSITASIPAFFARQDVSNPFFLLTFTIAYMLMNIVNLSALSAILKFRGLAVYFGYYMLWAAILAVPAFI